MDRYFKPQRAEAEKELSHKIAEAERIGEALITIGLRLKQEPWNWSIGWLDSAFPESDHVVAMEPELEAAVDKRRLMYLLDDIRMLKRRAGELKRLIPAE